jgi:hypothetical protein
MTEPAPLSTTSPDLPVNEGIVSSMTAFSNGLTLDLTDEEISQAYQIIVRIKDKYSRIFRAKFGHNTQLTVEDAMRMIDQMEDELVTTLAERMDLIATVDASPVFEGEGPIIDLVGALSSHSSATYGMDHEKKEWEVKRAIQTKEDFLGQRKISS